MIVVSRDNPFQEEETTKFTPEEAEVIRILESHRWHRVRISEVSFKRGVRTVWHKHLGSQILVVQKGKGIVQEAGSPAVSIGPGEIVYVQPGQKHWHGATAKNQLMHLSIIIGGETDWFEEVLDEEYQAALDALA
jgi:quercetin dioxygenase-like cupin family protein